MITLHGLRKVYRLPTADVVALDGIDLHVPKGEIHGIVGESGAGKSTLIRCLTALEPPTEGSVEIDGVRIDAGSQRALRDVRSRIGMVFQRVNLLEARTAGQNIEYPLKIAKVPAAERAERVASLLDLVGLPDRANSYPAQLSGGQQQRVGIARAVANRPSVLLCDEPTSALDLATTRSILELIRSVRDRLGITVLIITHEMAVVREVCDAVTLLAEGRIVQSGKVADVIRSYGTPLARELNPIPRYTPDPTRLRLEIGFTEPGPAIQAIASLGDEIEIIAGTIETLAGTQSGRLHAHVAPDLVTEVLDRLNGHGVHARVAE
jgi:D-methionine transport system ATP-binding protein